MPDIETPCLLVIFGASGDLTKRKLIPSLYHLWTQGHLPESFAVLGVARTEQTSEDFRARLYAFDSSQYDEGLWQEFQSRIHYLAADSTSSDDWPRIASSCRELAEEHGTHGNLLFYLSVAPQFFEPIVQSIGDSGLAAAGGRPDGRSGDGTWQRIIVEKPFGANPDSAEQLNRVLASVFDEESIYRIDHYLGKELVQNLLVARFANSIFEPLWNQRYIDHVQISASETVGVEERGGYYDGPAGGALRDMVQSHLLQVLSIVAMEPPVSLEASDIRVEKIKVFKALRVPDREQVSTIAIRGQYGSGIVNGKPLPDYRLEPGVDPESQTDTFAAVRTHIDTWRWGGVPFYLRSGKALKRKKTEIVVYFKPTPHCLFREHARKMKPNQIVFSVQPNEGIRLRFVGKVPGLQMDTKDVVMDFDYVEQWKSEPPESYATLLHDAMGGDQTLFKHRDEIDCAWRSVQPILDYWREYPDDDLPNYDAGTWGPVTADAMMARENRYWRND